MSATFQPRASFSRMNLDSEWTDEQLYKRYGLTKDEIAFIESKIRPMEASEGKVDEEAGDE